MTFATDCKKVSVFGHKRFTAEAGSYILSPFIRPGAGMIKLILFSKNNIQVK